MKYIYVVLTMLSFLVFVYPNMSGPEHIQYYDMSEYEIIITPEVKKTSIKF